MRVPSRSPDNSITSTERAVSKLKNDEKSRLLGLSYSTARSRLERDLLFMLAKKLGCLCHRCSLPLDDRENFSIDHKVAWMSAPDPKATFFDISNIEFSHHRCNSAYTNRRLEHGRGPYDRGCRCTICRAARKATQPYIAERRRAQYERTGN